MKNRGLVIIIFLISLAGCSRQKTLTPPQFNLNSFNLPANRYIHNGQESSGKLAEQQFTAPILIVSIPPELPAGISTVPRKPFIVDLLIGIEGKVIEIKILESPEPELIDLIIDNLKQWHFDPARHNSSGDKVECWKAVPIYFGL